MERERDVGHAFREPVPADHLHHGLGRCGFRLGGGVGLEFQNEVYLRILSGLEVLRQRGHRLPVFELERRQHGRRGALYLVSVVPAVVVEHRNAVRGHPYVEFHAVHAQLVGLEERGDRILCRAVGVPEAPVCDHAGLVLHRDAVFQVAACLDDPGQAIHQGLVFRVVRLVEGQYAAVSAVVGDGRRVEDVVLFEVVDIGRHPVVRRVGDRRRGLLVEFELHGHPVAAGRGTGLVEAAVGDRVVEEVVGLLVGHVEAQAFPLLMAFGLPVGNPVEKLAFGVDVFAQRNGELRAVVGVLSDPVEAREFQVLEFGGLETFDQLPDVPFGRGDLILLFREIHLPAVNLAPVLLAADRFGKPQYDLMPEGGLSELFYLLSDAPVECRKRLALLENPIQQPLPFCPAGVEFLVAHGVVASRAVLELEEQEAVEEPVFRAVGKPVYDIGPEFIDRPVQPVAAALVDQSQILNSGRPVALLGGGFAGRGGLLPQRVADHEPAEFMEQFFVLCGRRCPQIVKTVGAVVIAQRLASVYAVFFRSFHILAEPFFVDVGVLLPLEDVLVEFEFHRQVVRLDVGEIA